MIINKKFTTGNKVPTSREIEIYEAFGLGLDELKEFILFDKVDIPIENHNIIYISGDSGGGKTTLLKEIRKVYCEDSITFEDIEIDESSSIINQIGNDTKNGLMLLSLVGLSDAFICLRKYNELSDGQKYRFKISKMIESNKDVLIIDEFCANLDRITSKIISYNIQKNIRKMNKKLIVATTHNDLEFDLKPDLMIIKNFGSSLSIKENNAYDINCSLYNDIRVEEGTYGDYDNLSSFHYKGNRYMFHRKSFKLMYKDEMIGIICYNSPKGQLYGRNLHTDRYKGNSKETYKLINEEITNISRVVILPKFRGIGLSYFLIKETMPLTGYKMIESLAEMGKYNPFFEKAGMKCYDNGLAIRPKKYIELLESNGFDLKFATSISYNLNILSKMTDDVKNSFKNKFFNGYLTMVRGNSSTLIAKLNLDKAIPENISDIEFAKYIKEYIPRNPYYYVWDNN